MGWRRRRPPRRVSACLLHRRPLPARPNRSPCLPAAFAAPVGCDPQQVGAVPCERRASSAPRGTTVVGTPHVAGNSDAMLAPAREGRCSMTPAPAPRRDTDPKADTTRQLARVPGGFHQQHDLGDFPCGACLCAPPLERPSRIRSGPHPFSRSQRYTPKGFHGDRAMRPWFQFICRTSKNNPRSVPSVRRCGIAACPRTLR